jgi:hypothetical protein
MDPLLIVLYNCFVKIVSLGRVYWVSLPIFVLFYKLQMIDDDEDDDECGAVGEMIAKGTEVFKGNLSQCYFPTLPVPGSNPGRRGG